MGIACSDTGLAPGSAPVDPVEVRGRELLQNGIQLFVKSFNGIQLFTRSFADGPADVQQVQKWLELWRSLDDGIDFSLRGLANDEYNRPRLIGELAKRIGADVQFMADANFKKENLKKSLRECHKTDVAHYGDPRLADLARASLGVTEESSLHTLESTCHQILDDLRARRWARIRMLGPSNRKYDSHSVQNDMYSELKEKERQLRELESTMDDTTTNPELTTQLAEVASIVLKCRQDLVLYWKGREFLLEYLKPNLEGREHVVHYLLDQLPAERVIVLLDDDERPDGRTFAAGADEIKEELFATESELWKRWEAGK